MIAVPSTNSMDYKVFSLQNQPFDFPQAKPWGLPSTRTQAEGLRVDAERRLHLHPKGRGLAPSKYQITLALSQKIDGGLSPFLRKDYSMSPLSTGHRVLEDGLKGTRFLYFCQGWTATPK
jgi:hypothetical protein